MNAQSVRISKSADEFSLSIVVPIYKEELNIPEFVVRVVPILEQITGRFEIIFALDPSPDRSEEVVLEHRQRDERIKLLKFSRRFGQPMATLAGLQHSSGDAVIVMDVDLQDPPELIQEMVVQWKTGYEVVLPQRRARVGEPWIKKIVSAIGYKIINKIADVNIPPNTGDFRLLSRRVVNEVLKLKESHGFLRGMVAVVGFKQMLIPFDRPPRYAGQTHYNRFFGSLRIGFNGIFCFSTFTLTLATQLGFLIAGGSFFLLGVYVIYRLMGWETHANSTLVILITFLGGVQLIGIGILGEYLGRIYEQVRERPKFIVEQATGFDPNVTSLQS